MENESKILELFEQVEMNKKITPTYRKLLRKFIEQKEQYEKQLNEERCIKFFTQSLLSKTSQ